MGFKECRKAAGLRQEEVARELQVSQACVASWEKGKWMPKGPRLIRVAALYGCTVDALLKNDQKTAD